MLGNPEFELLLGSVLSLGAGLVIASLTWMVSAVVVADMKRDMEDLKARVSQLRGWGSDRGTER